MHHTACGQISCQADGHRWHCASITRGSHPFRINLWLGFFFFKQKTAYEILRSDWSSDVCSSDLDTERDPAQRQTKRPGARRPFEIGRASCRERVCQYVCCAPVSACLTKPWTA